METKIKKMWIQHLINQGCEKQQDYGFTINVCQVVVESNPTEFTMDDCKIFCENVIIELLHEILDFFKENDETLRSQKTIDFAVYLFKRSMIEKTGIIRIWHAISEHVEEKWFVAPLLTTIIKESTRYVSVVEDHDLITSIKYVKECLMLHLKNTKLKKHLKDMKQVIIFLETFTASDQQSSASSSVQSTQPSPSTSSQVPSKPFKKRSKEVNDDFKGFVEKIHQNTPIEILGEFLDNYSFENPKKDAKYFLENAVRDEECAKKFAKTTDLIESSEFNEELFEQLGVKFRKQHSKTTSGNFTRIEVLATAKLIEELLNQSLITTETGESLTDFSATQLDESELSRSCLLTLKKVMDDLKEKNAEKKAESSLQQ